MPPRPVPPAGPPGAARAGRRGARRHRWSLSALAGRRSRAAAPAGDDEAAARTPARTASLRPRPGSATTEAPRPEAKEAAAGSEVTTWTRPAGIPAQAAARQSWAIAQARSRRVTPRGGCSRDLAPAPPLTGTTRCQDTVGEEVIDTIVPAPARRSTPALPAERMQSRPRQEWSSGDPKRQTTPAFRIPAGRVDRPTPADAPHQAGLARLGAPPRDGRLRRVAQPHLARRPACRSRTSCSTAGTRRYFLGKESVFRVPVVGAIVRGAEQIPVYRNTGRAADAFRAAVAAVEEGKCVGVYPEGTLTRDPDLWPMVGKTGAARIALDDPVPRRPRGAVGPAGDPGALHQAAAPVAAQDHAGHGRSAGRPRPTSTTARWTPRCCSRRPTASWRRSRRLLEELRGEKAPAERFDPRKHGAAGDRQAPTPRRDTTDDERSGLRHRQLGHGVRRGARRRRHDGARCGVGAPRSSTQINAGSNEDYLPGIRLPRAISATTDPAEAADGRRHRRAGRAVADAARQPRRRWGVGCCRATPPSSR